MSTAASVSICASNIALWANSRKIVLPQKYQVWGKRGVAMSGSEGISTDDIGVSTALAPRLEPVQNRTPRQFPAR
jgi:hypothetical protein